MSPVNPPSWATAAAPASRGRRAVEQPPPRARVRLGRGDDAVDGGAAAEFFGVDRPQIQRHYTDNASGLAERVYLATADERRSPVKAVERGVGDRFQH